MTDIAYIENLRKPIANNPLRILVSSCLIGTLCGVDGSSYGEYPSVLKLLAYDNVKLIKFCPEDFAFGTPREMCDIHGGNGFDVLAGKAKVLTSTGVDWTEKMISASEKMLGVAKKHSVELAILMDISAACGSQVTYSGNRFSENKIYQIGAGVCAAQLMRAGFKVISQRDYASLEVLYARIDNSHTINTQAIDHHQTEWYTSYFATTKPNVIN